MSLLHTLDDDIADILGSDHEESSKNQSKPQPQPIARQQIESQHVINAEEQYDTKKKHKHKNTKPEKNLPIPKKSKIKRRKKMLHSQSNRSLKSTTDLSISSPISMSKEVALSLLQSESRKSLHQNKSNQSITKQNNSDNNHNESSDAFDFEEITKPKTDESSNNSDNESNDSILDWLDEPRVKTQNIRKPLLPTQPQKSQLNNVTTTNNVKEEKNHINAEVGKPVKSDNVVINTTKPNKSLNIEQWKEWLELSSDNEEDTQFMYLAENAAKCALPDDWEQVNDNLYRNIRTDEKTMTHPLLKNVQNELQLLRNNKKQKEKETQDMNGMNNSNTKEKQTLRQITTTHTHTHASTKSADIIVSNIPTKAETIIETVGNDANIENKSNESICKYCAKSESLIVSNLRMELNETRNKLKKLMNDKSNLYFEIEEINNKTELQLNEQKQLLSQTYKIEINELENENKELRNLMSKLQNKHQTELINLERNFQQNGIKQKEEKFNELTLIEQRSRNELLHQMELHRNTIKELKKQHENEIETLNKIHQKQLINLRQSNNDSQNLDFLIKKMETSTINLNKLQKDIEIERDGKQKAIIIKENELLRDKKAYNELLEKFKLSIEDTKIEKQHMREMEDKLKRKEEKILLDLTKNNYEINTQINKLNEERNKFEINKKRWEKEKQFEINDIQRLKNEHNKNIKIFYEECDIQRIQMNKQLQILNNNKMQYNKMKKEFEMKKENLQIIKLEFEEQKHKFDMENNNFERKVQSINALSQRVYQQSENIKTMYNDSKSIEEQNNMLSMQLISHEKELKIMKQQILMEKQQVANERKCLEKEQLCYLNTKRNRHITHPMIVNNNNSDLSKINVELKELKQFVKECNENILNYKEYINDFKNKREIMKINYNTNNRSDFNPLTMSFPVYNNNNNNNSFKSTSFIPNSMQNYSSHTRSLKSLMKHNKEYESNNKEINNENCMNNLSKIDIPNITPKKTPKMKLLNISNNTNSTLQSSFVSMANIDTPITIDNKNKKIKQYLNVTKEENLNMPMTPKQMMPSLSNIHITQQDNQDLNVSNMDYIDEKQDEIQNEEIDKTKH